MRSIYGSLILLLLLGACSKQSPNFETKKEVIQEDKRNISEGQAYLLLDASRTPEDLKSALIKIEQFHKLDFSFEEFWRSLRFPKVDVSKLDKESLTTLEGLGAKSCAKGASESYLQFILYLHEVLPKGLTVTYLRLIGQHLEQCAPKHRREFIRPFLSGVIAIVHDDINFDTFKSSLPVFRSLLALDNQQLSREIAKFFDRQMIKKISGLIQEKKDLDTAITFGIFVKEVHPLDKRLMLLPLEAFASTAEQVEALVRKVDFEEGALLLKRLRDLLPFDAVSVRSFTSTFVKKIEEHFSRAALSEENSTDLALALTEAANIHLDFNKDVVLNLILIDDLATKLLSRVKDIRTLKSFSSDSVVVATALGRELVSEEVGGIKFPSGDNEVTRIVRFFLHIRSSNDHGEKEKKLKKICQILPSKTIQSLLDVHGPGCFKLANAPKKLVIEEDLELPFFSSVEAAVEKVVIKASRISLGVLDLSNRTAHPIMKPTATPASSDAVVVPLLIGLASTQKKGIFLPGSNYYFFYHFVYREPQTGAALKNNELPSDGLPGGSVSVPESSVLRLSLISRGSEGQKAPVAASGGKGSEFSFNESDFDLWIAEFINVESYLLTKSFRTVDNLKLLTKIAKRNEEMRLLGHVDPNFVTILSPEQRTILEQNLRTVNDLEGWKCTDLVCMLQKVSTLAMKEFSGLLEQEDYAQVLMNLDPTFILKDGPHGPVASDGKRGSDGKIITTSSF